ncbi:MAG: response regulator, partial [Candidatus Limnocylindria bacterium]
MTTGISLIELTTDLDPAVVSGLKSEADAEVFTDARIVIVDDQPSNLKLLEAVLGRPGYTNLRAISDPATVVASVLNEGADLILLDLHMPGLDGIAVMGALREALPGAASVPIVVLTADITRQARERALRAGAKDFLVKPLDATEVVLRVGSLLETHALHLSMRAHNQRLEELVGQRT